MDVKKALEAIAEDINTTDDMQETINHYKQVIDDIQLIISTEQRKIDAILDSNILDSQNVLCTEFATQQIQCIGQALNNIQGYIDDAIYNYNLY